MVRKPLLPGKQLAGLLLKAKRRHPSRRKAASTVAKLFFVYHAKMGQEDFDTLTLVYECLLNLAEARPERTDLFAMTHKLFREFPKWVAGLTPEEQHAAFEYVCIGLGPRSPREQITSDMTQTLEYVSQLPRATACRHALANHHPTLKLYRGVSARSSEEAGERMNRLFWQPNLYLAYSYTEMWQDLHPHEKGYVGEIEIETQHIYLPVEENGLPPYGFKEFLLDPSQALSSEIFTV